MVSSPAITLNVFRMEVRQPRAHKSLASSIYLMEIFLFWSGDSSEASYRPLKKNVLKVWLLEQNLLVVQNWIRIGVIQIQDMQSIGNRTKLARVMQNFQGWALVAHRQRSLPIVLKVQTLRTVLPELQWQSLEPVPENSFQTIFNTYQKNTFRASRRPN